MKYLAILPAALSLTACVSTVSEVRGTFTDGNRSYPSVTREFQRADGSTYSRMSILVGHERVSCMPDDVRDCRLAIASRLVRRDD